MASGSRCVGVRRVHDVLNMQDFQEKVSQLREPVILCGLDLGSAPRLWNSQYLQERCGGNPVKVHVCPVKQMDFILKNFAYKLWAGNASGLKNEAYFYTAGHSPLTSLCNAVVRGRTSNTSFVK